MTTVVADQAMGYMAADFMITSNDGEVAIPCETKIESIELGGDEYLVGLAGHESPCEIFLDWLRDGEWDSPPDPMSDLDPNEDFSIVLLGPDGMFIADKFCRLTPIQHRWYALGTGGPFAWAILEAGCGVHKAMETAVRMDPSSGFGYEVVYLDGTKETVDP